MSQNVSSSFIRDYVAEFHPVYQRSGPKLLGTVRRQTNVEGKSTTFQVVGKGQAVTKARHGKIAPMNQTHTPVEVTLADFYAGDFVDILDLQKLNMDAREAIQLGGAYALGRKADNQIITALDSTSTTISHTGIATRAMFLELREKLDSNDVHDDGERYGLLTPRAWSAAMTIKEFASADYVGGDLPYTRPGMMKDWMGIKWMVHTGLPGIGTSSAKMFVYHRTAVGHATGSEIVADAQWQSMYQAWWLCHRMSMACALIDDGGVVETSHNDTTAIPA